MIRIRLVAIALTLPVLMAADQNQLTQDKAALGRLQQYVGQWRGVGQLRRGSARGAWREESLWNWKFTDREALLSFTAAGGKYLASGVLRAGREPGQYRLAAKTDTGSTVQYAGRLGKDGRLIFVAEEPPPGSPARVSLRQVAGGDRLVILYESRTGAAYRRMAEVGYTRKGSDFGKGTSFVECVVTGGLGTIPVTHAGRTYFVCCSGCRDYFNENAAQVLAEYRARKEAERKQRSTSISDQR